MLEFFKGLKAEDLPDGQGWAVEMVQLSTHNGTHLDAPWHFHPTMNRGERSWTIDEVPLEWCLQPGVKRDFRHLPDGYVATAGDVEAELKRMAIRSRRWKSSWSIRSGVTSIGPDGADLHSGLGQLDRSDLWRQITASELGLHRFRYPVGRCRLGDRQSDQRDHKKDGKSKKSDAPAPLHTISGFAGSVERTMHGCLHRTDVPRRGIAQGRQEHCELLHRRRG